jgi:transposase
MIYHLLTGREVYRELGADYFDERERNAVERRLVGRLQRLGYHVTLEPVSAAA